MKKMQKMLALFCVCVFLFSCALPMTGCAPRNTGTESAGTVQETEPPKQDDTDKGGISLQKPNAPGGDTENKPESDEGTSKDEPKATKPTEEPNATKPAEEPKATKPAEEPKATKPTEEPKATKPAEEPKETKPVEEEKQDGVLVQISANVSAKDNILSESVTLAGNNMSANVPQGVVLNENTSQLVLTVTEKENSDSGVQLVEGQTMLPLDVHIQGISAENTSPITVNLGAIVPVGLNIGNYSLYHVENGTANKMNSVQSLDELCNHNDYLYDPANGNVIISVASFSEIAVVSDEPVWQGEYDFTWYDANTKADIFYISNADQLAAFSAIVGGMLGYDANSFEGKTVMLRNDINIGDTDSENGIVFYPIGYYNSTGAYDRTGYVGDSSVVSGLNAFQGTFDGNGNTISNFYQNTWEMFGDYNSGYSGTPNYYKDAMGLFAATFGATIKNLIIDNFQSDGEFTPTGCVVAYAGGPNMLFENIILTNCNPRVYNTGNGGIVGLNYNSTAGTADNITFRNITVDQSNKISALWGSYDVSCGGILGRLRENSLHDGTNTDGQKNTVTFVNCHVSAIMDVNNDVCANYQYYQYRYSGMFIGTVDYIGDVPAVGLTDVVTASGCTYKIGKWNEYWYCELVANSLASYTHDHQFSRLKVISNVAEIQDEQGNWNVAGNFVIPAADNSTATCYHIFKNAEGNLYQHFHDVADESNPNIYETKDINGDGELNDLKEDRQCYLIPFNQLLTGYGWGSRPEFSYDNISTDGSETSAEKFAVQDSFDGIINSGDSIVASDIFAQLDNTSVAVNSLNVYLSPVGEDSTVVPQHISGVSLAELGSLTFYGYGKAKITITDYWYCTPTVVEVEVVTLLLDEDFSDENAIEGWKTITPATGTDGSYAITDEKLTFTHVSGTSGVSIVNNQLSGIEDFELNLKMQMPAASRWARIYLRSSAGKANGIYVYFYNFSGGKIRVLIGSTEITASKTIGSTYFDKLQDVKISLIGNHLRISLAGDELINVTDDRLLIDGDTIAFSTYGYSATYDDIKVIDRESYLLRECFDDPTKLSDWAQRAENGAFTISNSTLNVTTVGKYGNYIYNKPGAVWNDYEVSATLISGPSGTWNGLILRADENRNAYHIRLLNGGMYFYRVINGSYEESKNGYGITLKSANTYTAGDAVNLRVRAVDNVITIYVNDVLEHTYTDTSEYALMEGTVGFWSSASTSGGTAPTATYDGIRVKDLTQ